MAKTPSSDPVQQRRDTFDDLKTPSGELTRLSKPAHTQESVILGLENESTRSNALSAIKSLNSDQQQALLTSLQNSIGNNGTLPDTVIIQAIGRIGASGSSVSQDAISFLYDTIEKGTSSNYSSIVREASVRALGDIGPAARSEQEVLLSALEEGFKSNSLSPWEEKNLVTALGKIGADPKRISETLFDSNFLSYHREDVVSALTTVAQTNPEQSEAVKQAFIDLWNFDRERAIGAETHSRLIDSFATNLPPALAAELLTLGVRDSNQGIQEQALARLRDLANNSNVS